MKQASLKLVEPARPPQHAAQVIARWNSWAHVRFADTGETMWVNLDEVEHRAVARG